MSAQIDPDVVDLKVLAAWMDGQGLPGGPLEDVRPLSGGTQNVLVRLRRGGREYVLRRGPKHLRARTNDVLRREARVLTALDGTDVPAPRVIAACTDEQVMHGAVFYLMTPVEGFNATTELPALHAGDPAVRHRMGLEAARALAALGAVDHEAVGLGDFGRPEGFLERQVSRWLSELDSYSALEGYPGPQIPGLAEVAGWLERNRPLHWRPGIMHGDYHLANLMFRYDGPQVAAIVDWEMCTIGDPLLDLGWLLATWPDERDGSAQIAGPLGLAGGLPSPAELVAAYAERPEAVAGRDLTAIDWYTVLACFKLGIVLEGTHARACAGKAPRETGDLLHSITLALFDRARRIIAS
ncbi:MULTISPECIES: phosphotransferase family protein [Thermomonospora]|uniref:Aminoglycoside phosphotransferase n=1 Tax=Thermomonospora curvata (strain ATCC 19995 / DSM 43183 / JCM 3096 / KCTC 9072 / NBRC 15933 / NCIMB 10081 / Henssen B9) TaxID=471852 RepID=D1A5Q9_THECD|nr:MULTISPECIES: phosphotransferase family protein [Thermomonospora]ACY98204.1 aminoglycoside phosphotransferase [Thermomonospora curvata DSM 43183]